MKARKSKYTFDTLCKNPNITKKEPKMAELKSFDKDNELSTKWSDDADKMYPKVFGKIDHIDFMDFETEEGKKEQLSGIDKKIYTEDGRLITVDEKTHRNSTDVVIEIWSDVLTNKQGWLFTSKADYISQIEPRQDKMLIVSMKTLRKYAVQHPEQTITSNAIRWQTSIKNGKTWKSGHVSINEKDFVDWANKTPDVEKPVIVPLHEYK